MNKCAKPCDGPAERDGPEHGLVQLDGRDVETPALVERLPDDRARDDADPGADEADRLGSPVGGGVEYEEAVGRRRSPRSAEERGLGVVRGWLRRR
jgi:hypothetical protein